MGTQRLVLPSSDKREENIQVTEGMETAWRTDAEPVPAMVSITSRSDRKAVPDKFPFIAQLSALWVKSHLSGQGLPKSVTWPRTPPKAPQREFVGQRRERIPQILKSNTEKLCNSGSRRAL
uniref:Uncharacterized protein n=1 Tax=Molossus molossus TaxID=27622 RepID=A0A7J8I972_MOLMO|nr:hypothetical protein HJG59_010655 [Molossus molossus]